MMDNVDLDRIGEGGGLLRLATLVIGSIEVILFTLFVHLLLHSSDPLETSFGQSTALLIAAPLILLTLPGLLLAWLDRAPKTAFTFVCLAFPAAAILWA